MLSEIYKKTSNPLNIRYNPKNKWVGQTGVYKGFCVFKNKVYGIRAAILLINSYRKKGFDTIEKIIPRFAPPCENDTFAYLEYVKQRYFNIIGSYDVRSRRGICVLVCILAAYETGLFLTYEYVNQVYTYIFYEKGYCKKGA